MKLLAKLGLCWRILRSEPGNAVAHALRELPEPDGDEMQVLMNRCIVEMLTVFSTHGHSGLSASYATRQLEKLLRYQPLRPLTGEDSEWRDVSESSGKPMWQNNRCGCVFKGADGKAYDIDGKVFREPSGSCYTDINSRVFVTFPYTPITEYVDVPA